MDAGLLVIDTGPAFMDALLRSNSEEHIRQVLVPLARLAERLDLIALVIAHLNKAVGAGAGQRIMGGAAWRNAPRLVLLVGAPPGQDIHETGDRVVVVEKTNLGVYPPAHAFQISSSAEDPTRAIIEWAQEIDGVRADDLVRPALSDDEAPDREAARDLLHEALADGPRIGKEVEGEGVKRGVRARTLRRAREDLGITRKAGTVYLDAARGPWLWRSSAKTPWRSSSLTVRAAES